MTRSHAGRRAARLLSPVLILCVATLAACSSGPAGDAEETTGGWSYTDDTGATITLDQAPERVASFTDYAVGLLSYGIDPVAIFGRLDVASDPRLVDYDISDTAIVGNSYGEIDLEALAEAAPDLIVTGIYPTDRAGTLDLAGPYYGFADVEQQQQLEKIAPVVAIEIGGNGLEVIESLTELASSIGASDERIATAKSEYDAAAADLSAAAAETDLEVTMMYADADGVYVTKPADEPESALYGSLGVDYTNLSPDGDYYWDIYSWENAGQMMTGDVLIVNAEGFQDEDLRAQPTFAGHPALAANQVYSWQNAALDYSSQADQMTKLAEILRTASPV
ncbi:ABC transporter substrate-binding protein [Pengzhenrongella sicca]|uniref:ABC transporter substrate-binding protein n=1 Tax=Pengzhenrongella sicca TaxID=2819238 RepID=A0A8A4ZJC7_9MICO|nr:ABC transporter substrate-binding protein [Pengzhenrongella sicca]QTE30627.1 ABC transporter substrate-binding protein [Pengzhenrongella sicca]